MEKYIFKLRHLGEILSKDNFDYWQLLVDQLADKIHRPPANSLRIKNVARKWELVSAYQKTVRRGNIELAVQLVSGMAGFLGERQYMWRRICTTAAEDVGASNPDLMCFVLAAASVFTPSTLNPLQTNALWAHLTRLMCLSPKSRLYCQFSLLKESQEESGSNVPAFHSTEIGRQVGKIVSADLKGTPLSPRDQWLVTANWRAEGMSVGPLWHEALRTRDQDAATLVEAPWTPPAPLILKGLPSYAYDKHTQTGNVALTRSCALPVVRKLFTEHPCLQKREALGWALFYEEGGKFHNELRSNPMSALEQRFVADRFGLSMESWIAVRAVVSVLVSSGQIDAVRATVLDKRGYCDNCIRLLDTNCETEPDIRRQRHLQGVFEGGVRHG